MPNLFTDIIPASFPALALAHFLALISPGPDFFLVVGHAARSRLRGSFFICAGIAVGNATYIILAIAGWTAIKHSPAIYRCLELAGAAYLIWMGRMLLRSGRQAAKLVIEEYHTPSLPRQFVIGLGSALLNPKNAIFYLTLMTVIIGPHATAAQQIFAGAWMTLLVFSWDIGIAAAIAHPAMQKALERKIPLIETIAGGFLIILAVSLVLVPAFLG